MKLAVALCCAVLLAPLAAAPAPAAAPPAAPAAGAKPTYQRYCSMMVGTDPAARRYQTEMAKLSIPNEAQDAAIATGVQRVLQAQQHSAMLPPPVHVMYRNAQRLLVNPLGPDELVIVTVGNTNPPHWYDADVDRTGTVQSVEPLPPSAAQRIAGFMRGLAAFMVMNQMLGGDDALPRAGCLALVRAWFAPALGVLPDLERAMESPAPPTSAHEVDLLRDALQTYRNAPDHDAAKSELTEHTLRALGPFPAIEIVYRDPGEPGDALGAFDVVRFGAEKHTYAVVQQLPNGHFEIGTSPLCLVGDPRCAKYYTWP
jgi:hypothetical protein